MVGINVTEAAKIARRLNKRWPGCTVGRRGEGPHEVRTADGKVIASAEDLGDCMREADAKARQKEAR